MAAQGFYKSFMNFASKAYKRAVASEIDKLGLRYEDLLNSSNPVVAEALALADPDVMTGRMRRLKRASDLCFKAKNYLDYVPHPPQDTFKEEIWEDVVKIQARENEFALMNVHKF